MEFELKEIIGKGPSSVVSLAMDKSSHQLYALKIIDHGKVGTDTWSKKQLQTEVELAKSLSHHNIVKCHHLLETPTHTTLVLEHMQNGDLFHRIVESNDCIPDSLAIRWFKQVVSGLVYLHSKSIVHCDIKPENILINADEGVKISDFGFAQYSDRGRLDFICGSLEYLPPEIILIGKPDLGVPPSEGYDSAIDMWSLGVTLYFTLSKYYPFSNPRKTSWSNKALYQSIVHGVFSFNLHAFAKTSPFALQFITQLLVVDPKQRLRASEAATCEWLSSGCDRD